VHTRIPLANTLKRGRKTERITCQRKSSAIGTSGTSGTWGTSFGYIGYKRNISRKKVRHILWQSYVLPTHAIHLPEEFPQPQREKFGLLIIYVVCLYYQIAREHSRPSSSPTQSSQKKKPLAFLQRVSLFNN
jgi:hypothetical protein